MRGRCWLGCILVALVVPRAVTAAELSVASLTMPPGSTATLEVLGDIVDEETFGVTIVVELVPTGSATGSLEFTPAPPFDIVQLGDPWPGTGLFSSFDTDFAGTNSPVLNGTVDDSGAIGAPVTFPGALSGFPVIAGAGASGVWNVTLTTAVFISTWEGLTTTLFDGTITIVPVDCTVDEDCNDFNDCTGDLCVSDSCEYPLLSAGTLCGDQSTSTCNDPDTCDAAGACLPNLQPAATECRPSTGECDLTELCTGIDPECPADAFVADGTACTDDGITCTGDACSGGVCAHEEQCPDNGLFCDGTEFCDLDANACASSGDPCPGACTEAQGCSCDRPAAESIGPRYLAVRPQPPDSPAVMKLLIESRQLTCLSKFVGFLACGSTGDSCKSDADCNECTGTGEPCLTGADCMACVNQPTFPCSTDSDCNQGDTCEEIQACPLSGLLCEPATALPSIDIDNDGVPDGTLGTLVDDPADAISLAPMDWVGGATNHCNVSLEPCLADTDCDRGNCLLPDGRPSATECSVSAQNCAGGETCQLTEICLKAAVYIHGEDVIPSELIDEVFVPTTYFISAQCGGTPTAPTTVTMRAWGDVAENNSLVNVTDISFILLVFQLKFDAARGLTKVGVDLVTTAGPCFTDPEVINATDLQRALRAFQRITYEDEVTSSMAATGCTMPCP